MKVAAISAQWLRGESPSTSLDAIALGRLGVFAALALIFGWRMFGFGPPPIERFFDDFFYYLIAAENWVETGSTTYFPGELTNGYHPLWLIWMTALYRVVGASNDLFFGLIDLSVFCLMCGFFVLFERFLANLRFGRLAVFVGASMATLLIAKDAATGVEMALVSCAVAALLAYVSRKDFKDHTTLDAAVIGLLGAIALLARLDAVMIAPLLALVAIRAWDVKRVAAAVAGAAPLYAYAAFNVFVFGHISTTSSAAKSLKSGFAPDLYFLSIGPEPVALVSIACIVLACLMLRWPRFLNGERRLFAMALALAPLLHFGALAMFSGWLMFAWYFYFCYMVAGLLGAIVVTEFQRLNVLPSKTAIVAGALIGFSGTEAIAVAWHTGGFQSRIAIVSEWLETFSKDHPGTYAMGDAAGAPGWVLDQPVVHLEGLMMSHEFLERIESEQPLEQVFVDYGVDYYVSVRSYGFDQDGCRRFLEPHPIQASLASPKMAASFCVEPAAELAFKTKMKNADKKPPKPNPMEYHVRIYKIDRTTGRAIAS